jgi:hypothetical protein
MLQDKLERANSNTPYWLPLESSDGQLWIEGPYSTNEEAMAQRKRVSRYMSPPAKYGIPFTAASQAEAKMRARFFF